MLSVPDKVCSYKIIYMNKEEQFLEEKLIDETIKELNDSMQQYIDWRLQDHEAQVILKSMLIKFRELIK